MTSLSDNDICDLFPKYIQKENDFDVYKLFMDKIKGIIFGQSYNKEVEDHRPLTCYDVL